VGLIVTGGIAPNRQGKLSPFAAKLTNSLEVCVLWSPIKLMLGVGHHHHHHQTHIKRLHAPSQQVRVHRHVTEAVHQHEGAKIAMQILHAGRYAYHPWLVAPSAIKVCVCL